MQPEHARHLIVRLEHKAPHAMRVPNPSHYVSKHQRVIFSLFLAALIFLEILRKVLDIFMIKGLLNKM